MRRIGLVIGLWVGVVCPTVLAQQDSGRSLQLLQQLQQLQGIQMDSRFRVNQQIPPDQRWLVDYGGYVSPQYYSIEDTNNNMHDLFVSQVVGYLHVNFDGANEIFMRLSTQYNDYTSGGSLDGFGSRLIDPMFDRAFYKFDLQRYEAAYFGKVINYDASFEGGRDLVYWGNGLVLGEELDGVMPAFSYGPLSLATLAAVTPLRTIDIQPDRPAFDYNTKRGFFGAMLTLNTGTLPINPFVYGLVQRDYNTEDQWIQDNIITNARYDSDYIGFGASGSLTDHIHYGVEGAFECGRTLSNSFTVEGFQLVQAPQVWDNIDAWAGDARLDYAPNDEHQSRLSLEGIVATGSPNRGLTNTTFNGNAPFTPDNAFNGFGLVSTGLAFGAPVSNLVIMRCGVSTFPFINVPALKRLQVGTDVYWINKENANAPIDESTNPATYLGWEPDFYINWQMLSDVTLSFRYGAFLPNAQAFSSDKARQFFYSGAVIAF